MHKSVIVAYCTLLHPCCDQLKEAKYITIRNTKNSKNLAQVMLPAQSPFCLNQDDSLCWLG